MLNLIFVPSKKPQLTHGNMQPRWCNDNMHGLSAVDHGFEPDQPSQIKPVTKKIIFAPSLLLKHALQHDGVRTKTGLSGATCLSTDCCFSQLAR